jgi:hypothetical protein
MSDQITHKERLAQVEAYIKLLNKHKLDCLDVDGIRIVKTKHEIKSKTKSKTPVKKPMTLEAYINSDHADITDDPDFYSAIE